jgi:hypothetical protein
MTHKVENSNTPLQPSLDIAGVSGSFNENYKEENGYCDDDCEVVEWIDDRCKYTDICPIGCGTIWKRK